MFHPGFFEAAAELGRQDALAELDHLRRDGRGISWRTEPIEV